MPLPENSAHNPTIMGASNGIERRDPTSGLILLGAALARAGRQSLSGELRVADRGAVHRVRLVRGIVSEIPRWDGERDRHRDALRERVLQLFDLPRPWVTFDQEVLPAGPLRAVRPEQLTVAGVLRRRALFDPKPLLDRIPRETLRLSQAGVASVRELALSPAEAAFVRSLQRPTPTALALWKRGLEPRHAAALVVALNLLDCFDGWAPGDLARPGPAGRLGLKIRRGAPDFEVLGVDSGADRETIDRAFRRISFTLHPDRFVGADPEARREADALFRRVSEAHARITRRRRAAPSRRRAREADVRSIPDWRAFLEQARAAAERGGLFEARARALKALAANPPSWAVAELKVLLRGRAAG